MLTHKYVLPVAMLWWLTPATAGLAQIPQPTTLQWMFKTAVDNAIAELVINSEGTTTGATPGGYAQLRVEAQDEVPGCARPPCSSDMNAMLRVMSSQFNENRGCVGTQCPSMAELYSGGALRLTAGGGGFFDVLVGNRPQLRINRGANGIGVLFLPELGLNVPAGIRYALCVDSLGAVTASEQCGP